MGTTIQPNLERATFGGGCFWGLEKFFRQHFAPGALRSVRVGYMGGDDAMYENPSYKKVCTGETGHAEVLDLQFDKDRTSYEDLCKFFWRMHDPTTPDRQGNDVGTQYRSVVFYHTEEQRETAEKVKQEVQPKFSTPIVTHIVPASKFWPAEEYHQQYLTHNPSGYCNHKLRW